MKKFIEEFKAFALRGNIMGMAVGVIIGVTFIGIVISPTDNFINPILNLVTGAEMYGLSEIPVETTHCSHCTSVLKEKE